LRGSNQPKRRREERQREQREAKERRRTEKRQLSPVEAETARCDTIAGHPTTREERDAIRQQEVRELRDFIEAGRVESERLAAERKAAKGATMQSNNLVNRVGALLLLARCLLDRCGRVDM